MPKKKADERVEMFVTITRDLKRKLIAEATACGLPLNEVAVAILADAYNYPYVTRGSRFGGATETPNIILRMPLGLRDKIQDRAHKRRIPDRHETMAAFNDYFIRAAAA